MTNKSHWKLGLWRTCLSCSLRKFSLQGSGSRIVSGRSDVCTCRRYGNYIALRYEYTPKLTILQVAFLPLRIDLLTIFHLKKFYSFIKKIVSMQSYNPLLLTLKASRQIAAYERLPNVCVCFSPLVGLGVVRL